MTRSITPIAHFAPAPTAFASAYRRCAVGVATLTLCLTACREGLAASRRYDTLRARGVPHHLAIVEALDEAARG